MGGKLPKSLRSLRVDNVTVKWNRFLQFGSPHSLSCQSQFIAADRSEIWVNVGYRLSAFGFLASDKPKLDGNYGFKDQWMALEWIKENIQAFGGKYLTRRCPSFLKLFTM